LDQYKKNEVGYRFIHIYELFVILRLIKYYGL